jgi:OFA family oxalate/formate antiporter-like MFS transporter
MNEKEFNRWIIVVGALLIQLALGSIYAFSIFTSALSKYTGHASTSLPILGIFATGLAFFAITMIPAGRMQDKYGPKYVATLGAIIYGLGYLITFMVTSDKNYYSAATLAGIYFGYGVVGGVGIGLGYVCPIAAAVKWFPDKKGLVSGIAVAGFGAGAFIFTQLGSYIINGFTRAESTTYPGLSLSFLVLGIIFLAMTFIGAQMLRNPPEGWKPKGWEQKAPAKAKAAAAGKNFTASEMIHTRQFALLWLMFMLSATAGLMMIGNVKNVSKFLSNPTNPVLGNPAMLVMAEAALIAGILALLNGAGRVFWGGLSDKWGRSKALSMMLLVQTLVLYAMAMLLLVRPSNDMAQFASLATLAALIGFTFGGNFALFPATTADFFGTKHVGFNYGIVFTAYGVAGIAGALIPAMLAGTGKGFVWVFMAVGSASLLALLLSRTVTKPSDI